MNRMLKMALLAALLGGTTAASASDSLVVNFHENCQGGKGKENLGAIGAVLGKIAIGGTVDWVAEMVRAQAEKKVVEIGQGKGYTEFFRISEEGDIWRSKLCMSVLRLGRQPSEAGPDADKVVKRVREVLRIDDQKVLAAPDFYADFDIVAVPGRADMFALRAHSLYLGRSSLSAWGSQPRSVILSVAFSLPASPDNVFGSAIFEFADARVGQFWSREQDPLFQASSGLLMAPAFTPDEEVQVRLANAVAAQLQAPETAGTEGDAMVEKVALQTAEPMKTIRAQSIGLINAVVKVDETREASSFWKAISGAFESNKEDLKTTSFAQLIPAERRKVAVESDNASDDLRSDFLSAKLAVDEQAATFNALGDDASDIEKIKARAALAKAQINANKAARKAGITPLPYPELAY